ncbi:hypothetical protein A2U01_0093715, partial [Trifolium medium]|nr:hypothetical protein [Trifolium medium]
RTTKYVLRGMNSIVLRTRHNMDGTICTIKTYANKEKPPKEQMYLTDGWYKLTKANDIRKGDKLQFQVSDPPDVLVVDIV